jgi:hypothetical protein
VAVVSMFQVGCVKFDTPSGQNYYPAYTPTPNKVVAMITDLGLVNDTSRKMMVTITGLEYKLTNTYGTFLQTGSVIQLKLLTNMDGIIPSGIYTYSDSSLDVPFTFKDAFLSISGNYIPIIYGSIKVDASNSTYNILFSCNLSASESFTALYNGPVGYYDYY